MRIFVVNFVVHFVVHFVDKAHDKARDKACPPALSDPDAVAEVCSGYAPAQITACHQSAAARHLPREIFHYSFGNEMKMIKTGLDRCHHRMGWLGVSSLIRWLSNRSKASAYLAYAVGAVILGVFLLCILSWPLSWLVQYVVSMGLTPRRVYGLLYSIAGGLLVVGFIAMAFKKQAEIADG